jgi:hypothetical protein
MQWNVSKASRALAIDSVQANCCATVVITTNEYGLPVTFSSVGVVSNTTAAQDTITELRVDCLRKPLYNSTFTWHNDGNVIG